MAELEIWPNGDIEIGADVIGGERVVAIRFVDGQTGQAVVACFNLATFVTVANHIDMVSAELLKPGYWPEPKAGG